MALPATTAFVMLSVIPSIPLDAPFAEDTAVFSRPDRLVLTLLMEAFAPAASTWITSSSLLSAAMWLGLFAFEPVLFFFDDQNREELVGSNVVEGKRNADLKGSTKVKRPAQELSSLGMLRGVQPVERAFFAAASKARPERSRRIGRVRAEINVAQFFPPQRPIDQEAQGGLVGPLRS